MPRSMCRSEWQTPLAAMRTKTSPLFGGSTSASSIASGELCSYRTAARMSGVPPQEVFDQRHDPIWLVLLRKVPRGLEPVDLGVRINVGPLVCVGRLEVR